MCSIFCKQHLRAAPHPVWTGPDAGRVSVVTKYIGARALINGGHTDGKQFAVISGPVHTGRGAPLNRRTHILEHSIRPVHTGCMSRFACPSLMLLATCVNTPIYCSVFYNLRLPVARCSASCVNGPLGHQRNSFRYRDSTITSQKKTRGKIQGVVCFEHWTKNAFDLCGWECTVSSIGFRYLPQVTGAVSEPAICIHPRTIHNSNVIVEIRTVVPSNSKRFDLNPAQFKQNLKNVFCLPDVLNSLKCKLSVWIKRWLLYIRDEWWIYIFVRVFSGWRRMCVLKGAESMTSQSRPPGYRRPNKFHAKKGASEA